MAVDYSNQNASDLRFCPQKLGHEFKINFWVEFSSIRSLQLDATIWRWIGTRRSRGGTKKCGKCEFYSPQIFVSFFPQIHPIHVSFTFQRFVSHFSSDSFDSYERTTRSRTNTQPNRSILCVDHLDNICCVS